MGGAGLFYFSGHGIEEGGVNYLIPVKSRICNKSELKYRAVNAGLVLAKMESAKNRINIIILDACRSSFGIMDNSCPNSAKGPDFNTGLAPYTDAPIGSIIAYAAAPGKSASDGYGTNSPYTSALVKHMQTPGLSLQEMFYQVRKSVRVETDSRQIPWEATSLEDPFYFKLPEKQPEDSSNLTADIPVPAPAPMPAPTPAPYYAKSSAREIKRDGTFIAYDDGTVLDTSTNLMWAAKDNGENVNWKEAKEYCENYQGGGYTDWRMPTIDELEGLYEKGIRDEQKIIYIYWGVWSSNTSGSSASYFHFTLGFRDSIHQSASGGVRALPVRESSK
ncbi:DUF1566 [Desulfonema limicola]|uniref:DUF1566 n=1 Tax=Desulfonema limicola TaxID=45656 RepID=A0A975GGJ8_9BACT|nr:caspase family protein [Desulfonema limicola]QTA80307.1 DUF1566 [Desulfonema limicola]